MSRKEALGKLREVLLVRREALRKALAGDLSLLRQLADDGGGRGRCGDGNHPG